MSNPESDLPPPSQQPTEARPESDSPSPGVDRRGFLKGSAAGVLGIKGAIAGIAALGTAGIGAFAFHKAKGTVQPGIPTPIRDDLEPCHCPNQVREGQVPIQCQGIRPLVFSPSFSEQHGDA